VGVPQILIENEQVKVYPNPTTGIFTFQANKLQLITNSRIEVFNVLGEMVYSQLSLKDFQDNSQLTIDLSSNPNGVYFYRVVKESGEMVGSGKVIIER
jgi:hypothetical protein